MPITFSVKPSKKRVDTMVRGALLDADPVTYMKSLLEHPEYEPGFSTLVVLEDVTLGSFSTAAVRRLAEFTRRAEAQIGNTRVAMVASQPAVFGVARMYQLLRQAPYELRVFRRMEGAAEWLSDEPGTQEW